MLPEGWKHPRAQIDALECRESVRTAIRRIISVFGGLLMVALAALGLSEDAALASSEFTDVDGIHATNIDRIAEAGVTYGCNPPVNDRFCPERAVTRAEMASFLQRAFDVPRAGTTYFTTGGVHVDNINAIAEAGITAGCNRLGTQYCPDRAVPRKEMVSFLARAMDLSSRVSIPLLIEPGDQGSDVQILQEHLRSLGYAVDDPDGVYSTGTIHAIMAFQKVHELTVDGIYGPETRRAMEDPQTPSAVLGSFTTPLVPGQDRNINIHLAADLIDGHVISPGSSYSLDDGIGPRTRSRGFVSNGYIDSGGDLISVVGGGVSQMGTTFLNAAWFAGIGIAEFRQHTIYFERYPMCREATLARNVLDVVVVNDTPYPVTISTSYTSSSVTVSLVGAPWADVSSWTGDPYNIEGVGGAFSITCGREVTYPDGGSASEDYWWRYNEGYPG